MSTVKILADIGRWGDKSNMTEQQILDRLWTMKNAAYDPDYTQTRIVELLLHYAPRDVQEAVGRVYANR